MIVDLAAAAVPHPVVCLKTILDEPVCRRPVGKWSQYSSPPLRLLDRDVPCRAAGQKKRSDRSGNRASMTKDSSPLVAITLDILQVPRIISRMPRQSTSGRDFLENLKHGGHFFPIAHAQLDPPMLQEEALY